MKVLFDHQIFAQQRYGGVSKYFAEVIRRMPAGSWKISNAFSDNHYLEEFGLARTHPFPIKRDFPGKGRILNYLGMPVSIVDIVRNDFDVFHQTNFHYYSDTFLRKPMVTTYHDVNFLTGLNRNERMIRLQTRSLRRADHVVAVSENTRKDLLEYFSFVDPAKVTVIHHGIDAPYYATAERVCEYPYILFVGMRHMFKNFRRFAEAFALMAPKYPGLKVVCTRYGFSAEEREFFRKLGIEERMEVVEAPEETLNRLYRDAEMFVFPSLYEGFGMPILEAMVNGCPVALADASCFPEIAGDAGAYFEPESIDSIAATMSRILDDTAYRDSLVALGRERSSHFSWQRTADAHMAVYQSLL